jgi:glutamyl-tRNA synthetase
VSGSTGVRVRFAPAPTGFLHVGGARTALFNWLYARRQGGTLVLRIEDTDLERSKEEWVEGIQATLRWLGLDWDEGPYRQSERLGRYQEAVAQLVAAGRTYDCYCTEEDLEARAAAAKAAGTPEVFGYDGHCRTLADAAGAAFEAEGRPRSIRFRTPDEGTSTFSDLVRGEVSVDWANITDFVIVRSTGSPVFFLANAVDDADMGITHVIRGEDLLDSTHRVLALREALGVPGQPVFAHLPLLVGADRAKLSKRHGAVSLEDFAARGYLPEALRNYLGLLGFPAEEGAEVTTIDEMVAAFDLARVNRSPAFFDYDKLNWMDGEYIRALPLQEFAARALPFAVARYGDRLDPDVFTRAVGLAQERSTTLVDAAVAVGFLFIEEDRFEIEPDSVEKMRKTDRVAEILAAAIAHLERCEWTPEAVDLRPVLDGLGLKARKALPAVYAAVEGRSAGLPLFEAIVRLGRQRTLARLRAALAQLT